MRVRCTSACVAALLLLTASCLGMVADVRIGDAKKLADGEPVTLTSKVLYFQAGSTGYVEETDRAAGIRVEGLDPGTDNNNRAVTLLSGVLGTTPQGERFIELSDIEFSDTAIIAPLGANNAAVRADMLTGLKVRTWGTVLSIDTIHASYTISDGADAAGIKVFGGCPGGEGEIVAVTGAAAFEGERVIYALSVPPAPPAAPSGPMLIRWDPNLYGHGQNVVELQVLRDVFAGYAAPVRAIHDASQWNLGYTDLSTLYGHGPFSVTYYDLPMGATTPTVMTQAYYDEWYGITHSYRLRALLRMQTGVDAGGAPIYTYQFTAFGGSIIATAVEPVSRAAMVSPLNGDPVLISQLWTGDANFVWRPSAGGDEYRVTVWPVQPGTAPTWTSGIIYHSGEWNVALPDWERLALAALLSSPLFADRQMLWRVDARHTGDTSPGWVKGEQAVFEIGSMPPGPP